MYENALTSIGLGKKESEVYETLLRLGPSPIPKILENATFKRGDLYNILDQLQAWNLIEIEQKGKQKLYKPAHPSKLEDSVREQEQALEQNKKTLESALPELISMYRLYSGKPGVRYFEGREGVAEVLNDSLTAKEEIRTYADIEVIVKHIDDVNKKYVAKREKLDIKKRAIIADSPFAQDYLKNYHKDVTDIRLIGEGLKPFENVMQVYDGKVSYLTLNDDHISGIIIQDKTIYEMHRNLFDFVWKQLKPLRAPTPPSAKGGSASGGNLPSGRGGTEEDAGPAIVFNPVSPR